MSVNLPLLLHAPLIIQFHLLVAFIAIAGGGTIYAEKSDLYPQDNWPIMGVGNGAGRGVRTVYSRNPDVWRVQPYSFFIFADVVFPVYGRACGAEKTDKAAPTNYDLHIFSGSYCHRVFHPMARPLDAPYFASRGQPVIRLVTEAITELVQSFSSHLCSR